MSSLNSVVNVEKSDWLLVLTRPPVNLILTPFLSSDGIPRPESIRDDIVKLRKFIEKDRFAVGYFVMIRRKEYPYKDNLDLTQLGFKEKDYRWDEVDSSFANKKFQTLIVFVS